MRLIIINVQFTDCVSPLAHKRGSNGEAKHCFCFDRHGHWVAGANGVDARSIVYHVAFGRDACLIGLRVRIKHNKWNAFRAVQQHVKVPRRRLCVHLDADKLFALNIQHPFIGVPVAHKRGRGFTAQETIVSLIDDIHADWSVVCAVEAHMKYRRNAAQINICRSLRMYQHGRQV